jgi:chromosome segregation ATPase
MSALTQSLYDNAALELQCRGRIVHLMRQAAERIEELEAKSSENLKLCAEYDARGVRIESLCLDVHNLSVENGRVNDELDALRAELREEQREPIRLRDKLMSARRERDVYLKANKDLTVRIDELNSANNHKRDLLHKVADDLGMGSRDALPSIDWYREKVSELRLAAKDRKGYLDTIAKAVDKTHLSPKDLAEYFLTQFTTYPGMEAKVERLQHENKELQGRAADASRAANAPGPVHHPRRWRK